MPILAEFGHGPHEKAALVIYKDQLSHMLILAAPLRSAASGAFGAMGAPLI